MGDEVLGTRRWIGWLALALLSAVVVALLAVSLRARTVASRTVVRENWEFVVSDLIDSNARLRDEIASLQAQVNGFQDSGGAVLEMLVDEVNTLRVANGLVEVSGSGVEVTIAGPVSVLDLQDLINELRNAGAEALALNGQRLVAWSAIGSDGAYVTVDGQPVQPPFRMQAIGPGQALETALARPGGLVALLRQAEPSSSITIVQKDKMTLPVYGQRVEFVHAKAEK